jgi:AbrB family looped-hinge helix DNA binding protein
MTLKVGPKGQVVIPKKFRDEVGLHPGDEVEWDLVDGSLRVFPLDEGSWRGRFAGRALVSELEDDRRAERDR